MKHSFSHGGWLGTYTVVRVPTNHYWTISIPVREDTNQGAKSIHFHTMVREDTNQGATEVTPSEKRVTSVTFPAESPAGDSAAHSSTAASLRS